MLRRLSLQTAGESHGRGLFAILTGLPAGVPFDQAAVDAQLARRQGGRGRSSRQRLERDTVEVLAGLHRGRTSGAPLALAVWNVDSDLEGRPPLTRPRPGHADLAGGQKYDLGDMRPVLERASARETAIRVAAGAVAATLLARLGVEVFGHVVALGGVQAAPPGPRRGLAGLRRQRDASPFYTVDPAADARMDRALRRARRAGGTLGGVLEVRAEGVPPGLGSLDDWSSRLDARLGGALLAIPALKAVAIGDAVDVAGRPGHEAHDPVLAPGVEGPRRGGNRAGGVEGGMSNGEPVVVRAWMKPLATLARPLPSWDYAEGRAGAAFFERSDVTAVPAASVVGEAVVALVLLDALLERTGGDHLRDVEAALARQRRAVARRFGRPAGRSAGAGRRPRAARRPGGGRTR